MSLFRRERAIEIAVVSAAVRVTVTPRPTLFGFLFDAVCVFVVSLFVARGWSSINILYRALIGFAGVGTIVAWSYQMFGSEVIEFDEQRLTLSKHNLGWIRSSEYPVADCRELQVAEQGDGTSYGLQCKVGWRTIKFGQYMSEDEAVDVLSALQATLPEVAQWMCAVPAEDKKHLTTLDLN